ncbi:MAG TPA: carboxypeptidase-like regulatory domain-containing protein [Gemmatimonadaceae bacterium]|nr:carboxypeptidase-like regulatory domain-containing protein [Gemmatimonadaceae bacterium]
MSPTTRLSTLGLLVSLVSGGPDRAVAQDAAGRASITGSVYDSITMRPLTDAVVQLAEVPGNGQVGTVRSARSDSAGLYRFTGVSPGTYLLGFQHVAIDSLGLRSPLHRVDVRTPSGVRVLLAVPSQISIVSAVCGRRPPTDSMGVLIGAVRDARSDAAIAGAYVSMRWGEVFLSRGGIRRDTPILDLFTNEEGWFRACVPGSTPVLTRGSHGNDVSGDVELSVVAHTVLRRDLYIGHADASVVGPDSTRRGGAPSEGERIITRGTGAVSGIVRGTDGRPITGVRIALLSGANEARSDDRGRFQLPALPHGTHTLEARAIGYLPAQTIVDIVTFRESTAEFQLLDVNAFLLDTVRVAAVRKLEAAAREGFERRRRGGAGYFLDEQQIDTIRAFSFKDLVRAIPGVRFTRGQRLDDSWQEYIEFTFGGRSAPCLPAIYLDGNLLLGGRTDLDMIVSHLTVRRIEVYHRGVAMPAEFASATQCGVLAIWTGTRRNAARPPR